MHWMKLSVCRMHFVLSICDILYICSLTNTDKKVQFDLYLLISVPMISFIVGQTSGCILWSSAFKIVHIV